MTMSIWKGKTWQEYRTVRSIKQGRTVLRRKTTKTA